MTDEFAARAERSALLEVADLRISYQGVEKVHPTSFTVHERERVAIVGESGSGKSSIANALGGFISPAVGTVQAQIMTLAGRPLLESSPNRIPIRREGISMIFQDAMSSLDPVATVGNQLLSVLPRATYGSRKARKASAEERLRQVGIVDPRRVMSSVPGQLSGGMRQRVMLAIALASEPVLLIADEPTSALDASLGITVMEMMMSLSREEGTALLFISHDIALSRRYSDRVMVMRHGTVLETIASRDLDRATHPYTRGLLACMPTLGSAGLRELPTLDSVGAHDEMAA
ncbi:ABC transporter ATP-binding protein [Gordonia rhizosphera]|uniref:Putative peptide ABC transporter ATP-binding protein n=1 Tax=Gordonia rhizosphera NBRC 16068 TaxID=1108045 RepID=K6V4E9_9ACTN|nr:ABC transporter ATP-binding protein [Gordonia rhizosphera]GAB91033.1 putative peptide ABC transporter ATP-binding protein [Gordonia rhizosphera NBRC 16068]